MDKKKLIQVVQSMRSVLLAIPSPVVDHKAEKCRTDLFFHQMSMPERVGHLLWMCDQIEFEFVPGNVLEKAFRWLGFLQGAIWAKHRSTIDQLCVSNRS